MDVLQEIVPDGTRVKVHNSWIGIIQGNDLDNTDEFKNLNYYVVPDRKSFDDEYMCLREDFEIIKKYGGI